MTRATDCGAVSYSVQVDVPPNVLELLDVQIGDHIKTVIDGDRVRVWVNGVEREVPPGFATWFLPSAGT